MAKFKDDSGNEVEAFTQEEVNKLVAENPALKETQTKLTEAEAKLDEAAKKIEEFSGSDKGQNMAALRQAKEAAEAAVEGLKKGLVSGIDDLKKRLDENELDKALITVAQGDDELAQKVKAEYLRIMKPEDNDEEKRKKMGDAYRLASGYSPSPSVLGRVLGSGGAPNVGASGSGAAKPELVEFGRKFGLTEEDFKKYGKK
jgi:TolA-binding protein